MKAIYTIQQACFASAIWTDQRHQLAGVNIEVDVAQRGEAAKAKRQASNLEEHFVLEPSGGGCRALADPEIRRAHLRVRQQRRRRPVLDYATC